MLIGIGERIDEAVPARNVADRPSVHFLIDPHDHLAAIRDARRRSLDVVGFYHSHPGTPATPSATDVAEASYPDLVTVIVSLGTEPPDLRLFRVGRGNFHPIAFVTVA